MRQYKEQKIVLPERINDSWSDIEVSRVVQSGWYHLVELAQNSIDRPSKFSDEIIQDHHYFRRYFNEGRLKEQVDIAPLITTFDRLRIAAERRAEVHELSLLPLDRRVLNARKTASDYNEFAEVLLKYSRPGGEADRMSVPTLPGDDPAEIARRLAEAKWLRLPSQGEPDPKRGGNRLTGALLFGLASGLTAAAIIFDQPPGVKDFANTVYGTAEGMIRNYLP